MLIRPWPALLGIALLLPACAHQARQYKAPSPAKMNASAQRLAVAVTKARETAKKAQTAVIESNRAADVTMALTGEIRAGLVDLLQVKDLPQEARNRITELQAKSESLNQGQTALVTNLKEATVQQNILEGNLTEAEAAKVEHQNDQAKYVADANKMAKEASDRSAADAVTINKQAKRLAWYFWHGWLVKIGAVLGGLLILGLAFMWFTGRLARLGTVIASKIP